MFFWAGTYKKTFQLSVARLGTTHLVNKTLRAQTFLLSKLEWKENLIETIKSAVLFSWEAEAVSFKLNEHLYIFTWKKLIIVLVWLKSDC